MLKDLDIRSLRPCGIMEILAECVHHINLMDIDSFYEHYDVGIYRHDGFKFNFDVFIEENCNDKIIDKWVDCGMCDNYEQIINYHQKLINDPNHTYVISLSTVRREDEPDNDGFRPYNWGSYIGIPNEIGEYEYFSDCKSVDVIYSYHIYEIA